ncbi:serine acetyltransferase [Roseiconus nitratireducens]|uniref:Serine acetyltransferase n=1 Tax=Roseiconus nitratireducens TaxID=2605748 RepID=A0A5M6D3R3_9BACT|nr:serine O-acetyltransferase [Roseiconus nitratireducens]KAA5542124.1 serine acetyltransferase [Roseiconus nitratireducens]
MTVSASVAEPAREKCRGLWDPGRRLLRALRDYQSLESRRGMIATFRRRMCVLRHRFWSAVCGADIPLNSNIGIGLMIPHPNGIVIHPGADIGVNCLIFQQVTIGCRDASGPPTIGGHVDIGAGAKVLGPITIGDHARIGANAVVTRDVPAGATVVGIPARVVGESPTNEED